MNPALVGTAQLAHLHRHSVRVHSQEQAGLALFAPLLITSSGLDLSKDWCTGIETGWLWLISTTHRSSLLHTKVPGWSRQRPQVYAASTLLLSSVSILQHFVHST